MNTVSIHQFTVVETFYQVLVVIDSTVVRFLDGTSRWSIIARNSQTNHGTIRQVDRTLHQSFAERTASYDNSSIPILHCTADNFAGGSRIFIYQDDKASITEISVSFGVEITAFGSPSFRVDNQFFLPQEFVGKVDSCIKVTSSVSLQVENQVLHTLFLKACHCFLEFFGSGCSEAVDADITCFRLNHVRSIEAKDRYFISFHCEQ